MQSTLYAGTIGQSVWRSTDNGDTWGRVSNGLFPEADIRALAVSPSNPERSTPVPKTVFSRPTTLRNRGTICRVDGWTGSLGDCH